MSDAVLVDTNILVYLGNSERDSKAASIAALYDRVTHNFRHFDRVPGLSCISRSLG